MHPVLLVGGLAVGAFALSRLLKGEEASGPFNTDCTAVSREALDRAVQEVAVPMFLATMPAFQGLKGNPGAQRALFRVQWINVASAALKAIDDRMAGALSRTCPSGSPATREFAGLVACEMMRRLVQAGLVDEEMEDVDAACQDPEALTWRLLSESDLDGSAVAPPKRAPTRVK